MYRKSGLSPLFLVLVGLLSVFVGHGAGALCLPVEHFRYVGDTDPKSPTYDPHCTDNDVQSAIDNASCPGTTIVITREHLYSAQHLTITDKSLTLTAVGDGVFCGSAPKLCPPGMTCTGPPAPTAPVVLLSGTGHSGDSVLAINGTSNVVIRYLEIAHGVLDSGQSGAGIFFGGSGSLTLEASTVDHNSAGNGAGITMAPSGPAELHLGIDTLILFNEASESGGGILIAGAAKLFAVDERTAISSNTAGSAGGGLEVIGPAIAYIGSSGYDGFGGVISHNTAQNGGGIAVFTDNRSGDSNSDGTVNLFTVDPYNPVRIDDNFAYGEGGAFYAKGYADDFTNNLNEPRICASDARIDGNSATDGAAIYLDWDSSTLGQDVGSNLVMNTTHSCSTGSAVVAQSCAPGVECSQIIGNIAQDHFGNLTRKSVVVVGTSSSFSVDGLVMRANQGDHDIYFKGDNDPVGLPSHIHNCLVADNTNDNEAIAIDGNDAPVPIDGCTFANNTIGNGASVFRQGVGDSAITLTNSLIAETAPTGHISNLEYVLSHDISSSDPTVKLVGDPKFVDPLNGNYHLQATSPAVDFAGGVGGKDIEGLPRDVDLSSEPNVFGPRDLGPYERQFACGDDTIFCNGFE